MKKNLKNFNENLRQIYQRCFECEVVQGNYFWLPKKSCCACTSMLNRHDEHIVKIKFVTPTVWREPKNKDDCYFCSTKTAGFNSSNIQKIQYAVVSSVTKASMSEISNKKDREVAVDMSVADIEIDEAIDENMIEESSESNNDTDQEEYVMTKERDVYPRPFNPEELNDLIRDLGLPKDGAELLASRLKERNLLSKGTRVSLYRNRDESFQKYFTEEDDLVCCNDVHGLMNKLKKDIYESHEWRLFIDSSKRSLKAVLLHNTNKYWRFLTPNFLRDFEWCCGCPPPPPQLTRIIFIAPYK